MIKKSKNKVGRPNSAPTKIITFRIAESKKKKAERRYGKKLTPMFHNWFNSIIE